MASENRPSALNDESQGEGAAETADSDVYAVFESLEQLREAQAHDAAVPGAKPADDGSLESVLTHYKDWLRTLA